jgi:hypothetical protein
MKRRSQTAFLATLAVSSVQMPVRAAEDQPTESQSTAEQDSSALRKPNPRQGQFIALGINYGGAWAHDTERDPRALTFGPNFTLRYGEALTSWFDLGLGLSYGSTLGPERLSIGRITAFARWYALERLFIHTGLGFGFAGGPDPEHAGDSRTRYGDVYELGMGYHFYLGSPKKSGGWLLSPSVTFEVGPSNAFTTIAAWVGLEISHWGGLSKNKLNLSTKDAYSNED